MTDPAGRSCVENGTRLAVVAEVFDEQRPGVDGVDVASDVVGVRLERADQLSEIGIGSGGT